MRPQSEPGVDFHHIYSEPGKPAPTEVEEQGAANEGHNKHSTQFSKAETPNNLADEWNESDDEDHFVICQYKINYENDPYTPQQGPQRGPFILTTSPSCWGPWQQTKESTMKKRGGGYHRTVE